MTMSPVSLWNAHAPEFVSDPFVVEDRADVIVVGAGLTGLITATLLARAGVDVLVLEARTPGAVTSGNTTAKISVLQGTKLSTILSHHSEKLGRAYVEANTDGQALLLALCAEWGVPVDIRDAYTYAVSDQGLKQAHKEFEANEKLGLGVEWVETSELPYDIKGAVRMPDQAQFDPMDFIPAAIADIRAHGGRVVSGVRVTGVDVESPTLVETERGDVHAENVVLATGIPILDRGGYFAKVAPTRSYAIAFTGASTIPQGMYLSADTPSRSVRQARVDGVDYLVIGGNDHPVGRGGSEREKVEDLVNWTEEHFPGAQVAYSWSAQDYSSHNQIPFVGALPRGRGKVYMATGYDKWGMTNAAAASLRLTAELTDAEQPGWAKVWGTRITTPSDFAEGAVHNAEVGVEIVKGWAHVLTGAPSEAPAEGDGVVTRAPDGLAPVGTSTVDGKTCAVSAVCPHLGGVVSWNDQEKTWDCPLHGSRFSAQGYLLEGPAVKGLAVRE
jgi:glycine/D-amino acid oxidase-like deaminating enzyme/nitrite reductase/ring-hydroxylating ferredoxin subunit